MRLEVSSTARLGLEAAPAGLCLLQDLINTASAERSEWPDALSDRDSAQAWLDDALSRWAEQTGQTSPNLRLTPADPPAMRRLREDLRALIGQRGEGSAVLGGRVDVTLEANGRFRYQPSETGWQALAALCCLEALLAERTGSWSRLKVCAYQPCQAAFFDTSRGGRRVWHSPDRCGNIVNLRASRARRRA